ncbi:alpha-1,4-polygalactosaminidase [Phaeovibrio sulfidiphilus]|uniref:Alpha-1,4-polygalactosaminidase n=1 Tax=Phaeovibrio sulfidiphilus TaxID=1220600 RepID=A0A8J7CBY9_9PROT|nr:alpha-1,4-polygalactosaminidase [Phaeovibrio sulfidiphilus]MBE1236693.1 alpha-1,4-polygalactosaminidase [Phaeovibrio sulfidiphilus]
MRRSLPIFKHLGLAACIATALCTGGEPARAQETGTPTAPAPEAATASSVPEAGAAPSAPAALSAPAPAAQPGTPSNGSTPNGQPADPASSASLPGGTPAPRTGTPAPLNGDPPAANGIRSPDPSESAVVLPSDAAPPDAGGPNGAPDTNPLMPRVVIDGVDVTEGVYRDPPPEIPPQALPNYRDNVRDVANRFADYAHARSPNFPVLVRGGEILAFQSQREHDLATLKLPDGTPPSRGNVFDVGTPYGRYLRNIAGIVMDQHFCAPVNPTITPENLDRLRWLELHLFSLERCETLDDLQGAIAGATAQNVLLDARLSSDLAFRTVPAPDIENANIADIRSLRDARNVLFVLDSWGFDRIGDWVDALAATNHDVLVIDPFFRGRDCLDKAQIGRLKKKALGPRRMVIARLSVGLARDTMPYWKPGWQVGNPSFLVGHFPYTTGVYWTDVMNQEWLAMLGGAFASLMDLGVDGIMLDGMTTFLRQEALNPI